MSRRTLALIVIVLVVLSLCCMCATGLSLRPPALISGENLSAPALDDIRNRLTTQIGTREITLSSGDQGCRVENRRLIVPEDATCRYTIPASADQTRQLTLALDTGTAVTLRLEQNRAISVDRTLAAGAAPYPLDIFRHEAEADARLIIDGCATDKPEVGEGTPVPKGTCVVGVGR